MKQKITTINALSLIVADEKPKGRSVVLVHGIFDVLHCGHVDLLEEAKKLGDVLIVGVDHDDNARMLKGKGRPINSHLNRMYVVSAIAHVDYVFMIPSFKDAKDVHKFITDEIYRKISPDIVATSVKSGRHGKFKQDQANEIGAKFVDIKKSKYKYSTSKVIERLEL